MSSEESTEEENLPLIGEINDDSSEEEKETIEDSTEEVNVNPPLTVTAEIAEDPTEEVNVNPPLAVSAETAEDPTEETTVNLPLTGETIEGSMQGVDADLPRFEFEDVREGEYTTTRELLFGELIRMTYIAMPMVGLSLSQYLIRAISMMMLGHVSDLALSGAAIASSFCNFTGFSLITGMAGALETLCGQAYGAGQYQRLGTYAYGAIIWMLVACLPISVIWVYFAERILISIGQDLLISAEAGRFTMCLLPSLFPYAIVQSLVRYLQTQSLVLPMFICSMACLFIHLPLSWALIFKSELGGAGAALAISISYWVNAILLWAYVRYSARCAETRGSSFRDVSNSMGGIIRHAIPSAGMTCLEWWVFEIIIMFGGLLPNPQLEASVLSICMTIVTLHYLVPSSFGSAASTRISNELGAGRPEMARVIVYAVSVMAATEVVVASTAVFASSNVLGNMFSNETSVVEYVNGMAPLLIVHLFIDGLQTALAGVVRGSGWQWTGTAVNLVAHYVVGITIAVRLGLAGPWGGQGLWCGLIVGAAIQCIGYGFITFRSDWNTQVAETRLRLFPPDTTTS